MASSAGLHWNVPPSVMAGNAGTLGQHLGDLVFDVTQAQAAEAEASMKERHGYTDRTGHATQSLYGEASRAGNVIKIELGGTVSYMLPLETMQGGRYATITPELRERVPKVASELRGLLS